MTDDKNYRKRPLDNYKLLRGILAMKMIRMETELTPLRLINYFSLTFGALVI